LEEYCGETRQVSPRICVLGPFHLNLKCDALYWSVRPRTVVHFPDDLPSCSGLHPEANDASRRRLRSGLRARSDPLVTPAKSATTTQPQRLRRVSQVDVHRNASMQRHLCCYSIRRDSFHSHWQVLPADAGATVLGERRDAGPRGLEVATSTGDVCGVGVCPVALREMPDEKSTIS